MMVGLNHLYITSLMKLWKHQITRQSSENPSVILTHPPPDNYTRIYKSIILRYLAMYHVEKNTLQSSDLRMCAAIPCSFIIGSNRLTAY